MNSLRFRLATIIMAAALPSVTLSAVAMADPGLPAPVAASVTGASIAGYSQLSPQRVMLQVRSAAMGKVIPVQLLLPAEFNARPTATWPTYYMLDGVGTWPPGTSNWTNISDTERFFARKNVLVVQPIGADATFFADWRLPDPKGGVVKWETFVTSEIPDVLEHSPQWRANGVRAISGLSMGAYGAMTLAARHPGFYAAAAAFSGYPHTTIPGLPELVENTVSSKSNMNPDNMYGDPSNPLWAASDPYNFPEAFRGMQVFISAGNGWPNLVEFIGGFFDGFLGIVLEVVSNYSSTSFTQLLQQKGIAATTDLGYPGVHGWGYWNYQYKNSWPTVARGLGLPAGDV